MYKLLNQPISESDLVNKQYVDQQISEELTFEYIPKFNYIDIKFINIFDSVYNGQKIIIGNYLYIIGSGTGAYSNEVTRIDLGNNTKESLSKLPYGGSNFTPVYDENNKIYVIGGGGSTDNIIQCYNIEDNTWEVISASNPLSIRLYASCYYNENIYLFGGIGPSADYTSIYKYDIKTKNFTLLSVKLKHSFISYFGSFTKAKDKIYLGDSFIGNIASKEIGIFDLSNETLSYITNPDPEVVYYSMSYYDNKIWFLFGGVYNGTNWTIKYDSCKYYDIKNKNWYFLDINNSLPNKEDSDMLSVYSGIYDNKIVVSYSIYDSSSKKYIDYLGELSISSNKVIAYLKENEKIYADGNLLTDNNEIILPETIYTATKDTKIYALDNINFGWIRRGGAGGPISIGTIVYTVWTDDIYSKNGEIWLKCNGQTISEDKYKILFGLLQKDSNKNTISIPNIPQNTTGQFAYIKAIGDIQDYFAPNVLYVGSILKTVWKDNIFKKDGEVWLKCNGQEFYPTDYPELSEFLKSSNYEYEPVIPTMTSNTTPSPFVLSASSEFRSDYAAYFATFPGNAWISGGEKQYSYDSEGNGNQYVKVDVGESINIKRYCFFPYTLTGVTGIVKEWKLEGSNDELTWNILDFKTKEDWVLGTFKPDYFNIVNENNYRYYKITILKIMIDPSNNPSNKQTGMGAFQLFKVKPPKNQVPVIPEDENGNYSYIKAKSYNLSVPTPIQVGGELYTAWKDDIYNKNNEVWLKCNGQEFNPNDYPELAEILYPDGVSSKETALIPNMTSANAPAPYVITCSSRYISLYDGWKAFDGNKSSTWFSKYGTYDKNKEGYEWISIDMGKPIGIDEYGFYPYYVPDVYGYVTSWIVGGSNDQNNWDIIDEVENHTFTTGSKEYKVELSHRTQEYRYYIFIVTKLAGSATDQTKFSVAIYEMQFYQLEREKYKTPVLPLNNAGQSAYIKAKGFNPLIEGTTIEEKDIYTLMQIGTQLYTVWNDDVFINNQEYWLKCNGQEFSPLEYPKLAEYITEKDGKYYTPNVGVNNLGQYAYIKAKGYNEILNDPVLSLIQVGTYMKTAWTDDIYTKNTEVWLKCNGQSFSKEDYPLLYNFLNNENVPDIPVNENGQNTYIKAEGYNELLENPILSIIQIGTYQETAWTDSIYANNGEVWLKCNGQSFDKEDYPTLSNFLKNNTVPNIPINSFGQNTYIKAKGYNEEKQIEIPIVSTLPIGSQLYTTWKNDTFVNNNEVWLRCNGTSFNEERYKILSEILGVTDKYDTSTVKSVLPSLNSNSQDGFYVTPSDTYTIFNKDTVSWTGANDSFNESGNGSFSIQIKLDKTYTNIVKYSLSIFETDRPYSFKVLGSLDGINFYELDNEIIEDLNDFEKIDNSYYKKYFLLTPSDIQYIRFTFNKIVNGNNLTIKNLQFYSSDKKVSGYYLPNLPQNSIGQFAYVKADGYDVKEKPINDGSLFQIGTIVIASWEKDVFSNNGETWLKCNNQLFKTSDYPKLAEYIAKKDTGLVDQYRTPNMNTGFSGQYYFIKAKGYNEALIELINTPNQIGSTTKAVWSENVHSFNNEIWLKCNGNIINQSEYPELADFLAKTNNINVITEKSIVPLMTSNNTPSPFVASASSTNNLDLNRPYKVFDRDGQTKWQGLQGLWKQKINSDGAKIQNVFSGNDFIQIQLDKTYKLSSYSLSTCDKDNDSGKAYSWKLEGSNDGINWSLINEIKNNSENKNIKISLLDQNISDFYLYRLVIYECYSTTQTDETKISPSIYNLSLFIKDTDSLRLPDIKLDTDNLYTYIKAKGSPITFPSPVQIGSQMFTVWTEDIHRINNEVWLKCNGQDFSKIDYPVLFNLTEDLRVPNIEKNNIGQYCYIKAAGFTAGSYNIEDGLFDQQVLTWDKKTSKWIGRIMTGNISTGNIGEIFFWGTTEAPEDSLLCDGSSISREEYSDLFAVIGTKYGKGDGETTFDIPSINVEIGGTIACIRFKNILTSSSLGGFILEAPIDNKEYVRKNGKWQEISSVPDSLQETLDNLLSKIEILEKEVYELKNPKVRSITILGLNKIVLTK